MFARHFYVFFLSAKRYVILELIFP